MDCDPGIFESVLELFFHPQLLSHTINPIESHTVSYVFNWTSNVFITDNVSFNEESWLMLSSPNGVIRMKGSASSNRPKLSERKTIHANLTCLLLIVRLCECVHAWKRSLVHVLQLYIWMFIGAVRYIKQWEIHFHCVRATQENTFLFTTSNSFHSRRATCFVFAAQSHAHLWQPSMFVRKSCH